MPEGIKVIEGLLNRRLLVEFKFRELLYATNLLIMLILDLEDAPVERLPDKGDFLEISHIQGLVLIIQPFDLVLS